jgi:hypothetical protein
MDLHGRPRVANLPRSTGASRTRRLSNGLFLQSVATRSLPGTPATTLCSPLGSASSCRALLLIATTPSVIASAKPPPASSSSITNWLRSSQIGLHAILLRLLHRRAHGRVLVQFSIQHSIPTSVSTTPLTQYQGIIDFARDEFFLAREKFTTCRYNENVT